MEQHVAPYLRELEEGFAWGDGRFEPPKSRRTAQQYEHKLKQFLLWLEVRTPTPQLLHAYRMHRQATLGRRPRTIRVDFTAIFSFFGYLERHGHAPLPRHGCIKLPSLDDAQRESPTDREVTDLFDAALRMPRHTERKKYLRGRALGVLTILAYAGLRRAEMLALETSDIWRDSVPWRIYVRVGKGAQPRQVIIGDQAHEYLDEWLATRRRWCFQHHHASDALFPVDKVRRLSDLGLDTLWAELRSSAGIERRITPHGMRHWYASRIEEGEGLKTAQELLGHKRPETTLQYLKTSVEKKVRAANQFGAVRIPDSGGYGVSSERDASQTRGPLRRQLPTSRRRVRG